LRWAVFLGGAILIEACAGPNTLARTSLKSTERARTAGAVGDGEAAARARLRATSLQVLSQIKADKRGTWLWTDVSLR
jgi:hypothetical protein